MERPNKLCQSNERQLAIIYLLAFIYLAYYCTCIPVLWRLSCTVIVIYCCTVDCSFSPL